MYGVFIIVILISNRLLPMKLVFLSWKQVPKVPLMLNRHLWPWQLRSRIGAFSYSMLHPSLSSY